MPKGNAVRNRKDVLCEWGTITPGEITIDYVGDKLGERRFYTSFSLGDEELHQIGATCKGIAGVLRAEVDYRKPSKEDIRGSFVLFFPADLIDSEIRFQTAAFLNALTTRITVLYAPQASHQVAASNDLAEAMAHYTGDESPTFMVP